MMASLRETTLPPQPESHDGSHRESSPGLAPGAAPAISWVCAWCTSPIDPVHQDTVWLGGETFVHAGCDRARDREAEVRKCLDILIERVLVASECLGDCEPDTPAYEAAFAKLDARRAYLTNSVRLVLALLDGEREESARLRARLDRALSRSDA